MFGWVPVVAVEGAPRGDVVARLTAGIAPRALYVSCGAALAACFAAVLMNQFWGPKLANEAS
jgi:hypothetical protein